MLKILNGLRSLFSPRDKWKLLGIVGLMISGALLEIVGLGLLLPVVAMFTKPELLQQNFYLRTFREFLGFVPERAFLPVCCLLIGVLYLLKNTWLFFVVRRSTRFIYARMVELSVRLYDGFLKAPYSLFSEKGKAELSVILDKVDVSCVFVLLPAMNIATDCFCTAAIAAALFWAMPGVMFGCAAVLGIGSLCFYLPLRRTNVRIGGMVQECVSSTRKLTLYSFEDIRGVKIANAEDFFIRHFEDLRWRKAGLESSIYELGQLPRLILEALAVLAALTALVWMLWMGEPIGSIILRFSLLIAAMSRLLPAASRLNFSFATIRQGQSVLFSLLDALKVARENGGDPEELWQFEKEIRFENVSFAYKEGKTLFRDFSLTIPRNCSLGVSGPTGGGKSTFIDLLLGFRIPDSGRVSVDGRSIAGHLHAWRRLVGYVPQFIVLSDSSIAENIAIGVDAEKIDRNRVAEVLKEAQLDSFVASLPQGMDSLIGENGLRLSGGQRQRLGIARALYRKPEILILDEATSALDNDTEKALMDALESLQHKQTIIMIAHRLSTLEKCDMRIEIGK